jgi:hypothetical protein
MVMTNQSRNSSRERKGGSPRREDAGERQYVSGRPEQRERNDGRQSERIDYRRVDRDNDLYERQSD